MNDFRMSDGLHCPGMSDGGARSRAGTARLLNPQQGRHLVFPAPFTVGNQQFGSERVIPERGGNRGNSVHTAHYHRDPDVALRAGRPLDPGPRHWLNEPTTGRRIWRVSVNSFLHWAPSSGMNRDAIHPIDPATPAGTATNTKNTRNSPPRSGTPPSTEITGLNAITGTDNNTTAIA